MSIYTTWARRWNIPFAALEDLRRELCVFDTDPNTAVTGRSESAVQAAVRIEASRKGWRVWRNNKGVLLNEAGTPVRFGICNDSPKIGRELRSGDLIGIDPSPITEADVGQPRGQFVSLECKPEGWRFTGTPHELGQEKWAMLVTSLGGKAKFVNRVGLI